MQRENVLYFEHNLSVTQADYLIFICEYARDHKGNSPGISEIADNFNVAWSTARWHVSELSNKRLVRMENSKIIVEDSVWREPSYLNESENF